MANNFIRHLASNLCRLVVGRRRKASLGGAVTTLNSVHSFNVVLADLLIEFCLPRVLFRDGEYVCRRVNVLKSVHTCKWLGKHFSCG